LKPAVAATMESRHSGVSRTLETQRRLPLTGAQLAAAIAKNCSSNYASAGGPAL